MLPTFIYGAKKISLERFYENITKKQFMFLYHDVAPSKLTLGNYYIQVHIKIARFSRKPTKRGFFFNPTLIWND